LTGLRNEALSALAVEDTVSYTAGYEPIKKFTFMAGFPDPTVEEIFLPSSTIISAGYDAAQRILYLKFKNSSIYRYFNVPGFVMDDLMVCSPGNYVQTSIRNIYEGERC